MSFAFSTSGFPPAQAIDRAKVPISSLGSDRAKSPISSLDCGVEDEDAASVAALPSLPFLETTTPCLLSPFADDSVTTAGVPAAVFPSAGGTLTVPVDAPSLVRFLIVSVSEDPPQPARSDISTQAKIFLICIPLSTTDTDSMIGTFRPTGCAGVMLGIGDHVE